MNIMKMKDKGEYGNKHLKVGVWDLLEGKVRWSKDSERAFLIKTLFDIDIQKV